MHVDLDELEEELRRMKEKSSYVKAKDIDVDGSSHQIGKALAELQDEGKVEIWSNSNSSSVWKINL